jgi:hypothetical protein
MPTRDREQKDSGIIPLTFEPVAGMNTAPQRAGVREEQAAWMDGFIPLAERRFRTLPDVGPALFSSSVSIVFFDSFNIGTHPYLGVLGTDGSLLAKDLNTFVTHTVFGIGAIPSPSITTFGMSQYGEQYLLMASSATSNGYSAWDGANTYFSGTLQPNIVITNVGSGYTSSPTVAASGGHGSGSSFSASVVGGVVVNISILNPGSGYIVGDTPSLVFTGGGGSSAAATISIWPFGVSGNVVQTYNGMVWVFNGNTFQFTAPGALANFATSAGGGSRQTNASYLRVAYTGAVSTNGFLFLLGDSSMDYISGVVTTGSVATTTFTQNNSDPEIGTPYPQAIDTWGTDIIIANQIGVFISSGGSFHKISDQLDGVYQSVPVGTLENFYNNAFNGFQLSVAKLNIFGKRCWIILVPIIDPVTGQQVNKLLLVRDKKIWFASNQSVNLNFIGTYDFNGIIAALGTDGAQIYPLLVQMGGGFTKTLQSKLWDDPGGIEFNKAPSRFWSAWVANSTISTSISLTVDSVGLSAAGQMTSQSGYTIAGPTSVGYFITPPQAIGQQGVFVGMTLKTNAADMELITAKIAEEVVGEMT